MARSLRIQYPGAYYHVMAQTIYGVAFTLSPLDQDTDNDGIPDYAEVDLTDSDSGGIPDRLEEFWGLNKDNSIDDLEGDADSDGVFNYIAYQNGYDIYANWQPQFDADNDGMDDVHELSRQGNGVSVQFLTYLGFVLRLGHGAQSSHPVSRGLLSCDGAGEPARGHLS